MMTVRLSWKAVRAVARLLVVALAVSSAGPLAHGLDGHDADFQAVVVHDASQHRITGPPEADPLDAEQHCTACHLVRIAKHPRLEATGQPLLEVSTSLTDRSASAARVSLELRLPARAPPSLA